jgi:hypothetical protein
MGNYELAHQPVMTGMIDAVGRMASPEELAAVAAFLVSDKASFDNGIEQNSTSPGMRIYRGEWSRLAWY